jgi:hypothetical protein
MKMFGKAQAWAALAALAAFGAKPAVAQLAITQVSSTDWHITNGSVTIDWDATGGNISSIELGSSGNLMDTTQTNGDGVPKGLYMDNTGQGTGTVTTGYHLDSGHYLDWWMETASGPSNAFTYTQHFIVYPNDPGVHTYIVFSHSATDIAGSLGQVQNLIRLSLTEFTNTYSYNSGLGNLGATLIPQPSPTVTGTTDPGRQVQNAAVDLHGLAIPTGFDREFYTKYDYATYEYLHEVNGVYGSTYGCWAVFPRQDSMVAGPGKQNLIFTNNINMAEMLSDHLAYNVGYTPPQGVASTRIFGPVYFRFNTGTPAAMFSDALGSMSTALSNWDADGVLTGAGYVASAGRGTVAPTITGGGSGSSNLAWAVLGDNATNQQFTNLHNEYWVNNNSAGTAQLTGVVPGTYRLSSYVLGQWGEARVDNVAVTAAHTTTVSTSFTPENFSPAGDAAIWTIGTPTRTSDKFLHGTATFPGQGSTGAQDDREYNGNWNFWSDFSANRGAVVYYATAVGSHAATNNLRDWNYIQWNLFDPALYAGVYNASDDTTDGYKYIVPAYVGNPATTACPPWQVYFTTTAAQLSQGSFAILSVGLASTDGNVTVSLNGHSLTWNGLSTLKTSDSYARSGLGGTYQWVVFEWPTSDLAAAGASNEITLSVSGPVQYDALRMEIGSTTSKPSARGWHDYEWVTSGTSTAADDAVANP